jgi:KDO2-lipid IV(A) lauroyltransferase
LLRRTLVEFGKGLTELALLWTGNAANIRRLVKEVIGARELEDALKQDKGVILAMPHLGAWELVALYCGMHYDFTALYRRPRVAELDAFMRSARERLGSQLAPADIGGVRALHRVLHRGGIVGILPDQVPSAGHNAVYADFFGITARTMVLLSRLAKRTGAPVVFACAERLPRGRGYRLWFNRGPCDIESGDLPASVASLNGEVERHVRHAPAQYQWCYKRFRQRPPGGLSFYRTVGATAARHV